MDPTMTASRPMTAGHRVTASVDAEKENNIGDTFRSEVLAAQMCRRFGFADNEFHSTQTHCQVEGKRPARQGQAATIF
jgi:hypothetical protein